MIEGMEGNVIPSKVRERSKQPCQPSVQSYSGIRAKMAGDV